MKVILSRKGFDSSFGGYPSPILPDGTLISLPIPSMKYSSSLYPKDKTPKWKTRDNKDYYPLTYSDLLLPKSARKYLDAENLQISTFRDLLNQLLPRGIILQDKKKYSQELIWTCHLDPDIESSILKRPIEWRGLFGQADKAELHLRNNFVGNDDLFLFFGWFRKTIIQENKLIYDPNDRKGVHLIYGYLQVDYKLSKILNQDKVQSWMNYHPHFRFKLWNENHNTVYVAKDKLTWNNKKSGFGLFKYHSDLVLTETSKENNPKGNKSFWKYNLFPKELRITYHKPESYCIRTCENGVVQKYFKSAYKGQEFIITNPSPIINWVYSLFN